MRCLAKRSNHIGEAVADFKATDGMGAEADILHHQRDGACQDVRVGYGQGYALALVAAAYDDEVPRTARSRYLRRLDHQLHDFGAEILFAYDFVHSVECIFILPKRVPRLSDAKLSKKHRRHE